jgi:hypothetical protein
VAGFLARTRIPVPSIEVIRTPDCGPGVGVGVGDPESSKCAWNSPTR